MFPTKPKNWELLDQNSRERSTDEFYDLTKTWFQATPDETAEDLEKFHLGSMPDSGDMSDGSTVSATGGLYRSVTGLFLSLLFPREELLLMALKAILSLCLKSSRKIMLSVQILREEIMISPLMVVTV